MPLWAAIKIPRQVVREAAGPDEQRAGEPRLCAPTSKASGLKEWPLCPFLSDLSGWPQAWDLRLGVQGQEGPSLRLFGRKPSYPHQTSLSSGAHQGAVTPAETLNASLRRGLQTAPSTVCHML